MWILTLTKKYLDRSNGVALKMRIRIAITGLLLLVAAAALSNIQHSALAFAAGEEDNNLLHVRNESITTDIFELVWDSCPYLNIGSFIYTCHSFL